jgi:hypothetical protein
MQRLFPLHVHYSCRKREVDEREIRQRWCWYPVPDLYDSIVLKLVRVDHGGGLRTSPSEANREPSGENAKIRRQFANLAN